MQLPRQPLPLLQRDFSRAAASSWALAVAVAAWAASAARKVVSAAYGISPSR